MSYSAISKSSGLGTTFLTRAEADGYCAARPSEEFDVVEVADDPSALFTREVLADEIDEDPAQDESP